MKSFFLVFLTTVLFIGCTDELETIKVSDSAENTFSIADAAYFLALENEYAPLDPDKVKDIRPEWIKSVETLNSKAAMEQFGEAGKKGAVVIRVYPDKEDAALEVAGL